MYSLLINADDFGLHESINDAISECVETGIVNSVSIVANGRAFHDSELNRLRNQSIFRGIHITWVGERWLTERFLFDNRYELFKSIIIGGAPFLDKMKIEADAQINSLLSRNIVIDHIDSHQHIHHFPKVWSIMRELQRKYAINRIRSAQVPSFSTIRKTIPGLALNMLAKIQQPYPDYYCLGLKNTGNYNTQQFYSELSESTGKNIELIVHPGKNNNNLSALYPKWGFNWEKEFSSLKSEKLYSGLQKLNFTLIQKTK